MSSKNKFNAGDTVRVKKNINGACAGIYKVLDDEMNDAESVLINSVYAGQANWFVECKYLELIPPPEKEGTVTVADTFPKSGATKYDNGKPQLSLLARNWLEGVAKVMGFGAAKYGRFNWRKGHAQSRLMDAALRHLQAFNAAEDNDSESGECHLLHASACLMFAYEMHLTRPELDDRYKGESA
jgi:hypothetical protein